MLESSRYGSKTDFGERYNAVRRISAVTTFNDIIEKVRKEGKNFKEVVYLDDIHYMFQAVREGRISLNTLCDILEKVNELPEGISKILISDDLLRCYDEEFNDKRLHSFLFDFGELNYEERKDAVLSRNYDSVAKSARIKLWVEPFDSRKIVSFARSFGIYFSDEDTSYLINLIISGIPRRLVSFLKDAPSIIGKKYIFSFLDKHEQIKREVEKSHGRTLEYYRRKS